MSDRGRRAVWIVLVAILGVATFGVGTLFGRATAGGKTPHREDLTAAAAPAAPAELPAYRLLLEVPLGLADPRGIAAAPDGTIYACGDRALVAVDRSGAVKARWELPEEPGCVALGLEGRMVVGMRDHVEILDAVSGDRTVWPDLGSQAIVTSVAVVGSEVFVADAGNRMILAFDPGGRLVNTIDGDFAVPSPYFDVAAAPDGTLWVTDPGNHHVRHFGADGKPLGSWGLSSAEAEGFAGCCNPAHIAVLPCGSVVTSEKGLLRVKVHEPGGALESIAASAPDFPGEMALDLATRKANGGEVLVLVPGRRVVRVYVKRAAAGA